MGATLPPEDSFPLPLRQGLSNGEFWMHFRIDLLERGQRQAVRIQRKRYPIKIVDKGLRKGPVEGTRVHLSQTATEHFLVSFDIIYNASQRFMKAHSVRTQSTITAFRPSSRCCEIIDISMDASSLLALTAELTLVEDGPATLMLFL